MESPSPPKPTLNVAAICGSLRESSIHHGLIRSAIDITTRSIDGMSIELIDISSLPILNTDLVINEQFPPEVETFRNKILRSDCFLFASPEYNYSVTPPLKNAIDWASMLPNVWADKAAAVVSAGGSFGGGLSQYSLRQCGVWVDLHFVNKPEFLLDAFEGPPKFDDDGNLVDEEAKEMLRCVLLALKDFTLRLRGLRYVNGGSNV